MLCVTRIENGLIIKQANQRRSDTDNESRWCGISCDGVKIEETSKMYYKFVVGFIYIGSVDHFKRKRSWKIKKKVIFVSRCAGSESAEAMQKRIDNSLEIFNTSEEKLIHSFTFVMDCSATMGAIFGAFVLSHRVPFSVRWIGCTSYQLNTTMKRAIDNFNENLFKKYLECLKKVVTYLKEAGFNEMLPSGKALQQKVPTRFVTTFDIVK